MFPAPVMRPMLNTVISILSFGGPANVIDGNASFVAASATVRCVVERAWRRPVDPLACHPVDVPEPVPLFGIAKASITFTVTAKRPDKALVAFVRQHNFLKEVLRLPILPSRHSIPLFQLRWCARCWGRAW
ncbi:hypothetical protein AGR1C_Cc40003 [Agrobacterium fabacearum TT111]|nr:hypothetical protein AGR1C_Cc40003 [Agrobacterium fabacearum TT111]